jgi:hypothetical protein
MRQSPCPLRAHPWLVAGASITSFRLVTVARLRGLTRSPAAGDGARFSSVGDQRGRAQTGQADSAQPVRDSLDQRISVPRMLVSSFTTPSCRRLGVPVTGSRLSRGGTRVSSPSLASRALAAFVKWTRGAHLRYGTCSKTITPAAVTASAGRKENARIGEEGYGWKRRIHLNSSRGRAFSWLLSR